MKHSFRLFILTGLITFLTLATTTSIDAQENPVPKAKEKEELVDYEALVNDKLGRGITPEKNAVVLLWKALGPNPDDKAIPPNYFKRLGIEEPAKDGEYYVSIGSFAKDRLNLDPKSIDGIRDQLQASTKEPWEAKEYPNIATWLKLNDKPLAIAMEATLRPDYYAPLVTDPRIILPESIVGTVMPGIDKIREIGFAFNARAMLCISEGRFDAAWRDLLTFHRLGRLMARGGTPIEELVGFGFNYAASNSSLVFLTNAKLPAQRILECLKDLQGVPPLPPIADKFDLADRSALLQSIQSHRHNPPGIQPSFLVEASKRLTDEDTKALETIDWQKVSVQANQIYDRLVAALRMKDRAARQIEFDKIEKELAEAKSNFIKPGYIAKLQRERIPAGKNTSQLVGDVMVSLNMNLARYMLAAADRNLQIERNMHVAFALAAYKSDEGKYPAKLADLSPKYLAVVPDDYFSGKSLVYKPSEKGYLLYSVGPNGKDDDGRGKEDSPAGDDISVKMPWTPTKK